ncbi:hypothetical protein RNZ50_16570 [Paracoccaceae bacterium Fryx2]|nr:hypothetical protein [Paracoccaceae bacterium Fryx2]
MPDLPQAPGRAAVVPSRDFGPDPVPDLTGVTVLLVGGGVQDMRQVSIWIDSFGGLGVMTAQADVALGWLARPGRGPALAVVDCDDLGDAEAIVDFGFEVRRVAPDVPVILLSSFVSRSDLTTECMMVCDVTLRNPVSFAAFKLGLVVARDNHRHYLCAVHPTPEA